MRVTKRFFVAAAFGAVALVASVIINRLHNIDVSQGARKLQLGLFELNTAKALETT